ncbi:hypothetical protein XPU_4243, partial [Xanthomonas arboricola pv. pruni str. MAFF 311562]
AGGQAGRSSGGHRGRSGTRRAPVRCGVRHAPGPVSVRVDRRAVHQRLGGAHPGRLADRLGPGRAAYPAANRARPARRRGALRPDRAGRSGPDLQLVRPHRSGGLRPGLWAMGRARRWQHPSRRHRHARRVVDPRPVQGGFQQRLRARWPAAPGGAALHCRPGGRAGRHPAARAGLRGI